MQSPRGMNCLSPSFSSAKLPRVATDSVRTDKVTLFEEIRFLGTLFDGSSRGIVFLIKKKKQGETWFHLL